MVVLLSEFRLESESDGFRDVFEESAEFFRAQPGYLKHLLVRALDDPLIHISVSYWENNESVRHMAAQPQFQDIIGKLGTAARHIADTSTAVLSVKHSTRTAPHVG
ncbi:antibiotic biosynthesis monooxygenase [Streptomyces sp. NA02950]|uniref:antibiotic biosynthesis monooxygenase family protein n=1 Tax=Streptomyces sp. NA02950 TaxID=2742137 RepID=UPI0015916488|nr:antibiotic biosynthesis monooxygenase family protein [Streptomyces sp. NA02950]QKV93066.1 antibiotic biosynthesis monooxygenase [Streptomyces sp. NA02950]